MILQFTLIKSQVTNYDTLHKTYRQANFVALMPICSRVPHSSSRGEAQLVESFNGEEFKKMKKILYYNSFFDRVNDQSLFELKRYGIDVS